MLPREYLGYPIPDWAIGLSEGNYMEVGAQLCTKDGRKTGNAYVHNITEHEKLGQLATVVTDVGSIMQLTHSELKSMFYPPQYVMAPNEAARRVLYVLIGNNNRITPELQHKIDAIIHRVENSDECHHQRTEAAG